MTVPFRRGGPAFVRAAPARSGQWSAAPIPRQVGQPVFLSTRKTSEDQEFGDSA